MAFLFRMASRMRPSTPEEVVRSIKDSFLALPTKNGARALEEVEKNISSLRQVLSGDGETEPNQEQVLQIALEICKEDVLSLFVQNLPWLGWGVRKDLANCWCILLGQKVDENYCCVKYIEDHVELLDFLVGWCLTSSVLAKNPAHSGLADRDIKLLQELGRCTELWEYAERMHKISNPCKINLCRPRCSRTRTLTKEYDLKKKLRYILESNSFELFFEYVELPNFDIASDALNTFKDLLTKHETVVSEFLGSHYHKFFELYTRILTSNNYVTRRQSVKFLSEFLLEASNSKIMKRFIMEVRFLNIMIGLLKDSSKNIRICAFHVFKVFVANPNKPRSIVEALRENRRELLKQLHNLPAGKGEDELDEERDLIIQAIEKL